MLGRPPIRKYIDLANKLELPKMTLGLNADFQGMRDSSWPPNPP